MGENVRMLVCLQVLYCSYNRQVRCKYWFGHRVIQIAYLRYRGTLSVSRASQFVSLAVTFSSTFFFAELFVLLDVSLVSFSLIMTHALFCLTLRFARLDVSLNVSIRLPRIMTFRFAQGFFRSTSRFAQRFARFVSLDLTFCSP